MSPCTSNFSTAVRGHKVGVSTGRERTDDGTGHARSLRGSRRRQGRRREGNKESLPQTGADAAPRPASRRQGGGGAVQGGRTGVRPGLRRGEEGGVGRGRDRRPRGV